LLRNANPLANIDSGLAFLSKNGELWAAPELHRIHGDLLLLSGDASQSQTSYRRAIESAQQTGARLFELRAAACLHKPTALRKNRQNTAER
jgi:predicted negative regulator of RcsB-dependent stress response